MVVSRGFDDARMGHYCLMHSEFQFGKVKKGLEMDGGDGYTLM
jgi:hypothetical protein